MGGGRTWTRLFAAVAGVCCVPFSSGAENLRVVPGLRGSLKRREAAMMEPLSAMGAKDSIVLSRVFSSRIRDCNVISWAMACAERIWSTLLATGASGAGGITDDDR